MAIAQTYAGVAVSQEGLLTEKQRIYSIDIMRGIVMVIMALDHVRDFYHIHAFTFDPTDMTKTNPILFFTRWITHFCAPTFVLLSGVAARISLQRKSPKELSLFLLTRGLWLILLEVTVVRFAIVFNLYYDFIIFQVIWVIGAAMVVLAGAVHLSARAVLIIGLVLVFGHNIFDAFPLKPEDKGFALWTVLRQAGVLQIGEGRTLFVAYPLLPWLGILMAGYGLGGLYTGNYDSAKRRKLLLRIGLLAIVLFVILRATNLYGDPAHWSVQKNGIFSLMSFLNCTKYPPSLLYTLMTLGPVLMILSWMEGIKTKTLEPFMVFGRVPLFYYILHFYLIHITSITLYSITSGTPFSAIDFHFNKGFGGLPPGAGYILPWSYVAWFIIVLALYPVCVWYNRYKSTHKKWWLSYL
jgi:uncharacterized membrane protein